MIILDTSFLIAFYNKRDSRHREALKIFDEIANDKLVISDYSSYGNLREVIPRSRY